MTVKNVLYNSSNIFVLNKEIIGARKQPLHRHHATAVIATLTTQSEGINDAPAQRPMRWSRTKYYSEPTRQMQCTK